MSKLQTAILQLTFPAGTKKNFNEIETLKKLES
jgi:hypothetical protein